LKVSVSPLSNIVPDTYCTYVDNSLWF